MNLRPLGYEPNELPDCSTPRQGGEPYPRLRGGSRCGRSGVGGFVEEMDAEAGSAEEVAKEVAGSLLEDTDVPGEAVSAEVVFDPGAEGAFMVVEGG